MAVAFLPLSFRAHKVKSQLSATSLLLTAITSASLICGACNANDSSATNAAPSTEAHPDRLSGQEFIRINPAASSGVQFSQASYEADDGKSFSHNVEYPFCVKKPLECPEGAPLLPPLRSEEYFAGLPERSEAIDPRLQWLVDEASLASDSLFMSCRCGVCRVVQPLETFDDKDRWLVSFQDAVQKQWKDLGDYNMVITSERPIEVPEGFYAHVYLNYAAINAR